MPQLLPLYQRVTLRGHGPNPPKATIQGYWVDDSGSPSYVLLLDTWTSGYGTCTLVLVHSTQVDALPKV